jgi:predicted PurR-regulated permease PerM
MPLPSAQQGAVPPPAKRDPTHLILVAVSLVAVATALWLVADAIVVAFGGIVLASVLLSMSTPLARVTGMPPKWSLMVVVAGLLGIAALLSWLFGNELARELAELQRRLPAAAAEFVAWLNQSAAGRIVVDAVKESGANAEAITQASAIVTAILAATANLLLIIFLAIYFASDPSLYSNGALRLAPPSRRLQLKQALDEAGLALRKWVVAQLIAMFAVGAMTGATLGLMGVPLALSLGVTAGIMEFIPVIGPILAAIPAVLLAFAKGPEMAFYVVLVYIAVQQIESNIITPLVQRWAVKLPPVIGLLAIVACGLLFGVLGVVFAMPIAVVVMVLVKKLYVEDTLERRARLLDSETGAVAPAPGQP